MTNLSQKHSAGHPQEGKAAPAARVVPPAALTNTQGDASDSQPDEVLFRKCHDTGEILAVFPKIPSSGVDPDLVTTYLHVGQHGGGNLAIIAKTTDPATPEEYAALAKELTEQVGYNLGINPVNVLNSAEGHDAARQARIPEGWRFSFQGFGGNGEDLQYDTMLFCLTSPEAKRTEVRIPLRLGYEPAQVEEGYLCISGVTTQEAVDKAMEQMGGVK